MTNGAPTLSNYSRSNGSKSLGFRSCLIDIFRCTPNRRDHRNQDPSYAPKPAYQVEQYFCFSIFIFNHHFYFPAFTKLVPVGGFSLYDLLNEPWTQVSSLLPPDTRLYFYRAYGSAFSLLDFNRLLLSHAFALYAYDFLCKKNSLRTSKHSVGLEPTKLSMFGPKYGVPP